MQAEPEGELARDYEDLLQFVYASPVGLVQIAGDGLIEMINPVAMQLMLQMTPTPIITNFFKVMDGYAPELLNMIGGYSKHSGVVCENHHIHAGPISGDGGEDGKVIDCTLVKLGPGRFMVTIADISRQIAQERRLKQAETWFGSLLNDVNDFAVVSLDADGIIDRVNPSVLRQTGFNESETLGRTLEIFEARDGSSPAASVADQISAARRNGWHLEEGWHKRWGGKHYWCQTLIAVRSEGEDIEGSRIAGYTVVLRDVTRQEFNAGKLREMLTTDHLTGASNRGHFFEVAERERARARRHHQPLSLIAIDIDHFKLVNDTHGHGGGDEALRVIAGACMKLLRPSDIFARIGGEEFALLLPATDLQEAGELAERLRFAIGATSIKLAGALFRCTASFGCAVMTNQDSTVSGLLAAADAALYEAKRAGRNRVVLSSATTAAA
jgi:diguanylate cyclase (GGDEF)-like protein/PAS domain S-box-containing protein